jgi:hypothetical protein
MNEEVKETIKILQNNSLVKSGSYEFIGDSDITYAEIYILLKFIEDLQQENQQLKKVIDKAIEELKKGLHELDTSRRGRSLHRTIHRRSIKYVKRGGINE